MKLCLGTVQLGMKYGVAQDPTPSHSEAKEILEYALLNGITSFDTACAYGNSEKIIGEFLKNHSQDRNRLQIITKPQSNCLENIPKERYTEALKKQLSESLSRLQTDYVDTYLFHNSAYAFAPEKLSALYDLKIQGYIKHCGISVYYPKEALAAIESGYVDFIQLPFNLFDHRFYNENIFQLAKEKNIIIHARSIFLQGLFAMDPKKLSSDMQQTAPYISAVHEIAEKNGLTPLQLAMAFVSKISDWHHILIGVNSLTQLKQNITNCKQNISQLLTQEILTSFNSIPPKIYLPTEWKKAYQK